METINIPEVVKNLVSSSRKELELIITDAIPRVVDASNKYLINLASRGEALLSVVADSNFEGNKLSFVLSRIKNEKVILETEVFSFMIIGAGVAQNVINSIQNVIIDAIQSILPE